MDAELKEVQSQFSKDELLKIAKELGIIVDISVMYRSILDTVRKDLDKNGVPDPATASTTMLEFLYVLDYVDEDGEILEDGEEEEESVYSTYTLEDMKKEVHCFSYADKLDPSCNRCKIFDLCMSAREELRPECFGTYSGSDPDCAVCLEMQLCKISTGKG